MPGAAVLRESGKEVVVKVLKPGVEDVLATDLDFLYLASRALEFINPEVSRMSLAGIIGDIRACMLEEVRAPPRRLHPIESCKASYCRDGADHCNAPLPLQSALQSTIALGVCSAGGSRARTSCSARSMQQLTFGARMFMSYFSESFED